MQNRMGKNGLRNWMKTHMGRQVWGKDWAWDGWMAPKWGSGGHLSCTQLLQTTGVPLSALHLDSLCLVRDTHWNYSVRRTAFKRMKFLPNDCCLANTLKIIWFHQYLQETLLKRTALQSHTHSITVFKYWNSKTASYHSDTNSNFFTHNRHLFLQTQLTVWEDGTSH